MKSKFLGCCIIIALAISSYAGATWVQFGTGETTETTVLKSNDSHTIVEFTVPGMDVRDTVVDGTTYQIISVPTAGIPDEVGKPQTPVINRTVAVDPSKGVELNILEVECDTLSGFYIWPVQEPIPELMGVGPPEFVIDTVAYSQDSFYPDIVSEISDPMIWRDYRIVKLHCNPIQFNPVTGELRAYSRVKVSIDYSGTSDKNVLDKSLGPTPNYDKLYRDFIINYDYVTPKGPPGEGAYLIITHDDFYNAILPFAEWKHKKGIWTEVVKFSDINTGAPDSADIHNYIKWAYTNWLVPLEYVLLVGDVDFLACGYRPGSGCMPDGKYATDHCYSLIAGDDIFSDVYVGRLPANTTVECSTMVDKLINYERNPYMTATDWYKKYTGVCITQAGRIFDYTTGVIGHILDDYGYIQTDSLNSPLPQAISDSIEAGRTFVSYRAHGWFDSWSSVGYNTGYVNNLENGRKLPIVIAPTCLANDYYHDGYPGSGYDQCMGKAFVNQDQGAAGYFGATDVSYSFYNDSLAIGIFRGICEQHIYNFQTACDYGKWFMEQYFPLPNGITKKTFFMMNILGDPSLDMWTDTPKTLTVNYPSNTMPGSEFTVEVTHSGNGVKEALVCIWKGNEIYDSQYTNASGQATFTIPPDATKGPMNVTVTAHNYRPHEGKTYILHMYSYSPKATAYNNGRRIVRDSKGRYHLVYESDGKVYYTYSDDNGTHWAPENNISEYYDKNKSLSIAVDLYDTLHVVWQYTIGTTLKILYRKGYNNSWDDAISWSHGGVQENYLSVPAIHAIPVEIRQGETMQFVIGIMIVYRAPNGLKYVRYNKYDGWEGPDNVPSTSGDSHFPALEGTYGVFHLVWEEGGNIYYNCCEPPNSWGTKEKIPPASWIKDCHHPSVTLDYSSRPNVTWDAFSMVSQARDIIVARRVGSGWQMIGEFEYGEYPSIASYSTKDDLVLTLRRFSGACLVKPGIYLVKYSNGSWTQPTFIGSGVYPNLNIKADGHLVVWRGGSSAPYPIETYAVSEGKIASGGAQEVSNDKIPISFALAGYPNPFGGHTTIRYGIPAKYESKVISSIPVSLRIYDITGKLVKTLIDKTQEPGYFTITWNGRDEAGRKVSKGIYFYCLKAGSYIETKKLALLE